MICDRYYLSTVAYQGARGLDPSAILADSEKRFPVPDLALWLDIEPEKGLERVGTRGAGFDPIYEDIARLERAAVIFRAIDRPYVVRIEAEAPERAVTAAIVERLLRLPGLSGLGPIATR